MILDKCTIINAASQRVVYNWLQYFSLEALEAELIAHGLFIAQIYGDVSGSAYTPEHPEFAVAVQKAM